MGLAGAEWGFTIGGIQPFTDARADLIKAATPGGWVRMETSRTNYATDVPRILSHGLKHLALVMPFPHDTVPSDATWQAYVTTQVNFLAPLGVKHFEIWNEANNPNFFVGTLAQYTNLLKLAYPIIKAAISDAEVMTSSGAPGQTVHPPALLQGIYDNGGHGFFDSVGHHPYVGGGPIPSGDVAWNETLDLRTKMVANGDSALKIHATEFGWNTSIGGDRSLTEQQQADLATSFVLNWSAWQEQGWAGLGLWYTLCDIDALEPADEANMGLVLDNNTPKLGYATFRNGVANVTSSRLRRRTPSRHGANG